MAPVKPSSTIFLKLGFMLGWCCFGLAFIAAAAEASLGSGLITSTNDLLVALVPGEWIAMKARYSSFLFDHVILSIFHLPGWLLAGVPAGLLIWTCRPHRAGVDPTLYESLTTYDRLAALAEEEQASDDDPTFHRFDPKDFDPEDLKDDLPSPHEYMEDWHHLEPPNVLDGDEERPLGGEERMEKARESLSIPFDKLS